MLADRKNHNDETCSNFHLNYLFFFISSVTNKKFPLDLKKKLRISKCGYAPIGCQWKGPNLDVKGHEKDCEYPGKTGADVLAAVEESSRSYQSEIRNYQDIVNLLSFEKLTFNGKPQNDETCSNLPVRNWRVQAIFFLFRKKKRTRSTF